MAKKEKQKPRKFTFKTTQPTGRYRSFDSAYHEIKFNGETIGSIGDKKPHKIRLQVTKADIAEDGNTNCPWKWITLKHESESVKAAKEFLAANVEGIFARWPIHVEK